MKSKGSSQSLHFEAQWKVEISDEISQFVSFRSSGAQKKSLDPLGATKSHQLVTVSLGHRHFLSARCRSFTVFWFEPQTSPARAQSIGVRPLEVSFSGSAPSSKSITRTS